MNALESLLLGAIQGLSEFFPVSSSGHLLMLQQVLGVHEEGILFEIVVHVATLVSVLIFYHQRVASLTTGVLRRNPADLSYVGKLGLATVPAVVAVLLFGDFFEAQFEAPAVAGVCLIATGGILWTTRSTIERARTDVPTWGMAFAIGCAQVLAILPGISRSGTTVAAALALGLHPVAAAEFSFLMSVVAIAGAAARVFPELSAIDPERVAPLAVGGVAALVTGVLAIWGFVRLLQSRVFYGFAYYVWAVGAAFLAWLAVTGG
ncbi:MAG: undecaprenyl-diphosphate phosphatase [Myxococcota bacterium]